MALHEKNILCSLAIPTSPKNHSRFSVCPWEPAACKWVAAALPKMCSHYDLGAESRGNIYSAVSGRAAGRHVPAWVSVGLCIIPSLVSPPLGTPVCAMAGTRSCAPLGDVGGKTVVPVLSVIIFFFLPINHRLLVCSPFTECVCKGIPRSMQKWPFAHPSYRIRPIISTIASYDFFIYKYYINNV